MLGFGVGNVAIGGSVGGAASVDFPILGIAEFDRTSDLSLPHNTYVVMSEGLEHAQTWGDPGSIDSNGRITVPAGCEFVLFSNGAGAPGENNQVRFRYSNTTSQWQPGRRINNSTGIGTIFIPMKGATWFEPLFRQRSGSTFVLGASDSDATSTLVCVFYGGAG